MVCGFILLYFAVLGSCAAQELTLPVNICHRDAADYSTCLTNATQEAWPRFVQGLPEFSFPRLDPMFYEVQASYNREVIHITIEAINVTTLGLADTRFLLVRTYFANNIFHMDIDLEIPNLYDEGYLKIFGAVGPSRLNAAGYFNVTSLNVKVKLNMRGPVVDDRWMVEHFRATMVLTTVKIHLSDFFENKELNYMIEEFLNKNWQTLYKVAEPMLKDSYEELGIEIVNRLFSKVSFSKLFPK